MPVIIDGTTYYRTSEACQKAGISRGTFLRWVRNGIISGATLKDRNGWRLFTTADIDTIRAEAMRTNR